MHTTIVSFLLAIALVPDPPIDVSNAEVSMTDDASSLTTFDAAGEVSAELVLWSDGDERLRFDAVFPDGLYLAAIIVGESVVIESDDAMEVAARVEAIGDYMRENEPQEGWGDCAASAIETGAACALAHILCPFSATIAACHCLPLVVEEWEGMHCPFFG